ncbi:hypothetical protein GCK32_012377 [Trichostrongylus colubriformis]|uniref:Uncharacterized protein n=1 Tax=Trichostrongylus colubriformis TaxID=6319 RepID=A0AAN8IR77_TRICO
MRLMFARVIFSTDEGFAMFHQFFSLFCQIYILKYLIDVDINNVLENYAVTYISAAFQVSKFALYILAGEDFRDTLRKIVQNLSCCKVRRSHTIIKMQSSSAIKTTTSAK